MKTSPYKTCFKIVRLTTICNGSKRTIFTSGGLGLLQTVLEPDTGWCASKEAGPLRGWIVKSHIRWREGQDIPYKGIETSPYKTRFNKGVETSPYKTRFKIVRLTTICNGSKRTISTSGGFGLLHVTRTRRKILC